MSDEVCSHYVRRCQLVCPECSKAYTCRLCHNEKESHEIDRFSVKEVICRECGKKQDKALDCSGCGVRFGKYACLKCCMFDDTDKGQFHCDGCALCRVGGRDNFIHCSTCGLCIPPSVYNNHQCIPDASNCVCPVCQEMLHTSLETLQIPPCHHLLHTECYKNLLKKSIFACPVCGKSMVDMSKAWRGLDIEMAVTPMPAAYTGVCCQVMCKDCNKESITRFHVIALKCRLCGSYNTAKSGGGLLRLKSEATASSGEEQMEVVQPIQPTDDQPAQAIVAPPAPSRPIIAPARLIFEPPARPIIAPARLIFPPPERPLDEPPARPIIAPARLIFPPPERPLDASPAQPLDASPAQPLDASPAQPLDASPAQPLDASPAQPLDASPAQPILFLPGHAANERLRRRRQRAIIENEPEFAIIENHPEFNELAANPELIPINDMQIFDAGIGPGFDDEREELVIEPLSTLTANEEIHLYEIVDPEDLERAMNERTEVVTVEVDAGGMRINERAYNPDGDNVDNEWETASEDVSDQDDFDDLEE